MKYTVDYNGQRVGKDYKTLAEARGEMKRLRSLNLWGYSITKL